MMTKEQAKNKLEALERIKVKGIGYHGYTWCDTPFYAELMAQMEECIEILIKEEPSVVSEKMFRSRW